ncbi:MAG TPA: nucleotide disphospho-sugar-binding domain-containing protein, partial [Polyangiales bacterium]|nr:nucleotide disphospho-sugar-binding domain-containing protein [Polyangiales bacterium]
TTGGQPVESLGSALPENARVVRFIEYARLLPHVDVMITNGGFGGVQTALANGVPLIVAGDTEEKPEVAQRIGRSGVGLNLRTGRPAERQIREAVRRVLDEPRFRERAQQMQREIAGYAGVQRAADVIEQVVGSERKPLTSAA